MKQVCVTGGAGFIGSQVVRELLARDYTPVVLDNLSVGRRENVPAGVRLVEGDIRDAEASAAALDGCQGVLHLAARVAIRSSFDFAVEDADINVTGTANMLREAARSGQVQRFVTASSMAVYADAPSADPVPESHPTAPVSPYGVSKLAAERLTHLMCAQADMTSAVLRLFNTYGPGQALSPYVGVVTIFADALRGQQPVKIFGDGEQCRDFVHVHDVAKAFVNAIEATSSGQTYNIGTGRATSVNTVFERVRQAIGVDSTPQHMPAAEGELRYSVADTSHAREGIEYNPTRAFDDSISDVVAELAGS